MASWIKIASGVGTVCTVATVSYLSLRNQKSTTASQDLATKGLNLISSLPPSDLAAQWQAEFESDEENIKKAIGGNWSNRQEGGKRLQQWCNSVMNSKYSKDSENAQKWCVIRSNKSQMERKGTRELLGDEDEAEWGASYEAILTKGEFPPEIGNLGSLQGEEKKRAGIKALKEWCGKKERENFLVSKGEAGYEAFDSFCTKTKYDFLKPSEQ